MLGDRFQVERALSPDGSLVRARDTERDVPVLIRICDLKVAESFDLVQRFEREVALVRGLRHPQIPAFIASGQEGTRAYLVLEDIDGPTLAEELSERRYHETEVLDLVADVLPILSYLHELSPPVIHRDLTPSSLVRRRSDGRIVLRDLGSALASQSGSVEVTRSGTFGYMAPEQFDGQSSPATDLYALGVIALHLLTREEPESMLVDRRLDWQSHADCHISTRSLLRDLLAPDPAERLSSARAARERVERIRLLVLAATRPEHRREEEAATELDLPSNALLKPKKPAGPRPLVLSESKPMPRAPFEREIDSIRRRRGAFAATLLLSLVVAFVIWWIGRL